MRFRPANIRVINRRDNRLGRHSHCFPLAREEQRKPTPRMYLTGSSMSEDQLHRKLDVASAARSQHRVGGRRVWRDASTSELRRLRRVGGTTHAVLADASIRGGKVRMIQDVK